MTRVVDLALLRQATMDAMRVYEAVQQAQALTAESQRAIAAAEELLRQTTLAFLPGDVTITDSQPESSKSSREAMIAEYIGIQTAYAELKGALYQLVKAQMECKEWDKAYMTIRALMKIEPDYRDVRQLSDELQILHPVPEMLRAGQLMSVIRQLEPHGKSGKYSFVLRVSHDTCRQAIAQAIQNENWDNVQAIIRILFGLLGGQSLCQWLSEYSVPYLEIGSEHIDFESDSPDIWGRDFGMYWKEGPWMQVVRSGRFTHARYSDCYSICVRSPKDGVFHRLDIADQLSYEDVQSGKYVLGILIYKP